MTIGLWEISQHAAGQRIELFSEQTNVIAARDQALKELPGVRKAPLQDVIGFVLGSSGIGYTQQPPYALNVLNAQTICVRIEQLGRGSLGVLRPIKANGY
jgi:hypothetical protein